MSLSKCEGTDCTKRTACKRFLIKPLPRYQPWMVQRVSIPDPEKCRFYININEDNKD